MTNTRKALVAAFACLIVLCISLTFVVAPVSNADTNYTANWGTHELVQQADYNLRDGATESQFISYGPSAGGNVWYSRSVANYYDLSKVTVLPSYKEYNELLSKGQYAMSTVKEQVDYVTTAYGWDVLGAVNGTSFDTSSGAPHHGLMIEGVNYAGGYTYGFFAIMYNSKGEQKAVIGQSSEQDLFFNHKRGETLTRTENGVTVDYKDYEVKHAIGGWANNYLVYDGVLCETWDNDQEHPRTAIGIKADGTVVTYVCEGRNQGRAGGMSLYTMATIMKDLGCIYAINLDGGGSSTALSRHEGETTYSNRIEAAYGADRSVSSAILFVSTESYADKDPATTPTHDHTFARAQILPNQDLFISGTTVNFTATGSDAYGDPVALPEGLTWQVDAANSTTNIGTINATTGVFQATQGATGYVTVNLCQGETVVGSTKVSFAWPDWNYSNSWVNRFSIGYEEEQLMYFVMYPANNELNRSVGISTWRPFVIQECDFTWNLPTGCSVEVRDNFFYFKAGTNPVVDYTVSIAKINGTNQTSGNSINQLTALVNVGKAPEMIYDFEDGELPYGVWRGGKSTNIYIANDTNGKVLFGEGSMAIDYDFSACNYIPSIESGKANNPTVTWYNDNNGFNGVVPADAAYFGMWVWLPEGFDGCWLRVTFQGNKSDGSKGTNRTIMTEFNTNSEKYGANKVDLGTVGGSWRFYYGKMGIDTSTNSAWGITGPFSIYSVQFMWSAFNDTALGYDYGMKTGAEKAQAQADVLAKFNKASKGTMYFDNVMAMYGEPTVDMLAPYLSNINITSGEESSTFTFKIADEDRYDKDEQAAIKYNSLQSLGTLFSISGINYETLAIYYNGTQIESSKISVNETTGEVTVTGLPKTFAYNDTLRVFAYDNYYNKLDKTITLRKISYVSGVATEGDVAETTDYLFWEGFAVSGVTTPTPKAVDHDGYYFVEWAGNTIPSVMPANDIIINATYSNLYHLTIKEEGVETPLVDQQVAYGTTISLPTREGYTPSWVTETVPAKMPATETNLVCKFTINKYTLTFKVDGEVVGTPSQVDYNSVITTPNVEGRTGYTFAWDAHAANMPANDLTIEGHFTINQYTITFKQGEKVVATAKQNYDSEINLPTVAGHDVVWKNASTRPTKVPAQNIEIEVIAIVHTHTLIIMDGEDVVSATSVAYGTTITIPERENYEYVWSNPETPVTTMPDSTLTIYGEYKYTKFIVTYKQGEQTVATQEIRYGEEITLPAITGYDVAWKDQSTVPATMPQNAITLEVVLTVHTHKLTFKVDGTVVKEHEAIAFGTKIADNLPTVEDRTGYTFDWIDLPETMPDEDLVVEGAFTANKYTLTIKVDGEVIETRENVAYDSKITLPTVEDRTGYTFTWKNAVDKMPANDLTIEGEFTANKYLLAFYIDGTLYVDAENVAFGSAVEMPVSNKTGYSIVWEKTLETMPAQDTVINGEFVINKYTLTFKVDGEVIETRENVAYDSVIALPEVEGKTGHTFAWDEPATKMPASDLTIKGKFTRNSYKLTFKVEGEVVKETSVLYDAQIDYPQVEGRTGYAFAWDKNIVKMPAEATVINGTFTIRSFTLTFKVDGTVVKESSVEYGAAVEYPQVEAKTGHTFAWDKDIAKMPAEATEINGTYTIGQYTLTFKVEGTVIGTPAKVNYDSAITLPQVEGKTGYTFAWKNAAAKMPASDLTIEGAYTADVSYFKAAVDAVANATTLEATFNAIKAADVAYAVYRTEDKAVLADELARLNTLKANYVAAANGAAEDLNGAVSVVNTLLSALVSVALAAVAAVVIKRRLF